MYLKELEPLKLCEKTFNAIPDAITIIDRDHRVVGVNNTMAHVLGIEPEEVIGKHCYEVVHGTSCPIDNCPHSMLLHDDHEHSSEVHEENLGGFFLVTTTPIYDDDGKVLGSVHVARDITQRKIMEEQLQQALDDKDMLMKEIHHRVKNNLMIIASLLNLQSRYIEDEVAKDIFRDSQSRAKTMAMIHEKLYRSGQLKRIDVKDYIDSLANYIYRVYVSDPHRILMEMDLEEFMLDINTAIPLGLLLNELLTNAFKYAFPGEKKGKVQVKLHKMNNKKFLLEVKDDGVGLSANFDPHHTNSLGMQLIYNLTEQIKGELKLNGKNGAQFQITFQELKYNK
ncbi:MAG TPA: histidine kinase dimerization/phosphoacceptor domain -containing protein [Methanobacteriaceae archaeon]|nr:histidine kinase dimerization/phosphoacceptor domain -containing protein [Methanobacteriaceae archaeon]